MDLKQLVTLTLQVSIVSIVFSFGLRSTQAELLYLWRRPGLLLRSFVSVLIIMPIAAVVLTSLFELRRTVEIALLALAISPMPPLLPRKQLKAGGRQSYALALTATMAALAVVVDPLAVELLSRYYGRPLEIAPGVIGRIVLITVLAPLVAGIALRAWLPDRAGRLAGAVGRFATILLAVGVVLLLAGAWSGVWAAMGDGTILAMVVFVAIGLVAGHVLGGPDPEHSVVLALSSATRHPAIALSVASANFPEERFAGTILLYMMVGALASLPYLAWRRRRMS
jgi:BASS family bile acid:Na+ symporter